MVVKAKTRVQGKDLDPSADLMMTTQRRHFDELYARLNAGQRRAVDAIEGPVMVMAGPGTGKTQVLAMRIANILRVTQMDPWNILCLTFTESGVVAMRERLLAIIGTLAYYVRIHTFHSFCNEVIQENPHLFAWRREVQVISDIDRIVMFRRIVDGLSARSPLKPFGDPYLYFQDIASDIQDLKREDISPEEFSDILERLQALAEGIGKEAQQFFMLVPKNRTAASCDAIHAHLTAAAKKAKLPASMAALLEHMYGTYSQEERGAEAGRESSKARTAYKNALKKWLEKTVDTLPKQQEMAHVYAKYQEALRQDGRYDYEDMITKVVQQLKENDVLLARYQEQFQYILVDEYQDTNGAQNEVVDLLGSFDDKPNIFVVGDDKQSIYRFQGASLANMLHFYERYKDAIHVVSLKENYRSQQTILDAALGVITHNQESVARYVPGVTQELAAAGERERERVTLHAFSSEDAEDYFVAARAKELIESGAAPNEIAVLYRYNRDGDSLFRLCQRLGVPVRLEIGEDVLKDHLVQQWLALLTWIVDGKSDEQLARILQYSWWHLPAIDVLKAIHYAGRNYKQLYAVMSTAKELRAAGVAKPALLLDLAAKLAEWNKEAVDVPLQQWLEKLIVESHFLDHVMENDHQAAALRKVTTLLNEAKKLNLAHHEFTLADFMRHIALLQYHGVQLVAEPWQSRPQAVRLMSAHKAKGLEFEHVFVMRLNDKHWGNVREQNHVPLPQGLVKYDYVVADTNGDERRLFYVALTRAKQHVYLTRAAHTVHGRETVPAIFVHEVPPDTVAVDTTQETDADTLLRLQTGWLSPFARDTQGDAREYVRALLDSYVMSVTHLNNYLECPRRFYFRNLLQIPTTKTKSLAMGSAVHEALYDFFANINETGNVPSREFLVKQFERAMKRQLLANVDMSDALEHGRHILSDYYAHYQAKFHNSSLLEYSFAGHGVHVGDLKLTGTIDKVEVLDVKEKTVNVVDYKTGKVERGLKKLQPGGDYHRQLVFYKLLCDESPRFSYTMVSGEVDFVEEGRRGFMKKNVVVKEEEVDELKDTIQRVWGEIKELKFLDPLSGCRKKECEYCT